MTARSTSQHRGNSECDRQFSDVVDRFSKQVEEVTDWLFSKEEELNKSIKGSYLQDAPLNQLILKLAQHEKFMTEVCEYCHIIMKFKEEGQEMRDNHDDLTPEDLDEIGIQIDSMTVLYDKLKILTTDRLHNLQRIIESCQDSNMERLEKWLTFMETRLSYSGNIGPDFDSIQRQLREIDELSDELVQKQELLNLVSEVIEFEELDGGSSQVKDRSRDYIDIRLQNMNDRWSKICKTIGERRERLKKADAIWRLLQLEGPQLSAWLKKIQTSLRELAEAIRNVPDPQNDSAFISKLSSRSQKIDQDIKSKQSFYTSLEGRVRLEIEKFDDPCAMVVIELEQKLEDLQDGWNSIMKQKRMVDFSLEALSKTEVISSKSTGPLIPVPDSITSHIEIPSKNGHQFNRTEQLNSDIEPLTNSPSIGQDDDSSPQLDGSLSDTRAFDNSMSSQDTRSLILNQANDSRNFNISLNDSHDELSSGTNITYSHDIMNYPYMQTNVEGDDNHFDSKVGHEYTNNQHMHNGAHSCRVEEWRHSLDSFSSWLRQVESSLGMDISGSAEHNKLNQSWSRLDLNEQLSLLKDIESRILSTCQDEYDCLLLHGQQIIEDLMPEILENEYETNLKEILADIEMRYSAVKRLLIERKRELSDGEKWRRLMRDLKGTSEYIIGLMSEVIPVSEIGVDLINLAQQQDQLMHLKEGLANNQDLQTCSREARNFLTLCDTLQQQYGDQSQQQQQSGFGNLNTTSSRQDSIDLVDIWLSFREFKDNIESQLDRLTLHYSELSQLIDDRLERINEVHEEMHALQHNIQNLAAELQVAEILRSKWVPLEDLSIEQLSEQLEDLKLYRERLSDAESIHKKMNSIVEWMEQFESPISHSNLKRINELNDIWETIQQLVEERQKHIEQAFDEQSGSEQKFLAETVADLPNWERRVATSKVPYFIDHQTSKTLWDHPKFTNVLDNMNECKKYVFSVYRTATKLRVIQKSLGIDKLMLEQLKEAFESFNLVLVQKSLTATANNQINVDTLDNQSGQTTHSVISNDSVVDVEQIIHLLKIIFVKIQSLESPELNISLAIDLALNWLLNLFDSTRTGQVSVLSLKVGLTLICCAKLEEKYIQMFELVANNQSGFVDAKKLGTLFDTCMRIPTYLGESESFGGSDLIESSIRSCFAMSKFNPQHPNCIDLRDYLNWLKTEPQFIVWLPVLHRLLISESVSHPMRCKLCGSNPIIGLRYRCLKCFKYNICQRCFLTGRHIYEHPDPATHQMQEYCSKTSSGENVRDFTKILRNKLHLNTSKTKS